MARHLGLDRPAVQGDRGDHGRFRGGAPEPGVDAGDALERRRGRQLEVDLEERFDGLDVLIRRRRRRRRFRGSSPGYSQTPLMLISSPVSVLMRETIQMIPTIRVETPSTISSRSTGGVAILEEAVDASVPSNPGDRNTVKRDRHVRTARLRSDPTPLRIGDRRRTSIRGRGSRRRHAENERRCREARDGDEAIA